MIWVQWRYLLILVAGSTGVGCASAPREIATPTEMTHILQGMSRAQVRETCGGDDGALCLRVQRGDEKLEVRRVNVTATFRSYYLLYRDGKLATIHAMHHDTDDPLTIWSKRAASLPAEQPGLDAVQEIFGHPGLSFGGDFSSVDVKAQEEFQQGANEETGMIIALSWWNPIAWVALPIIGISAAADRSATESASQSIDAIPLGASWQQVITSNAAVTSVVKRPGGWTDVVVTKRNFDALIVLKNENVRGVFPYHVTQFPPPGLD